MTSIECLRREAKAAAETVLNKYPQNVALALSEHLNSWCEIGHRLGGHSNIRLLIDEINKAEPTQSGPRVQNAS